MRITTVNPASFSNWNIAKQSINNQNKFSQSLSNAINSSTKSDSEINEENKVDEKVFDKIINATEFHLPTGINMDSKGDKVLSSEQISRLKEKYDIENITANEMMDLLFDLADMEVISGEALDSMISIPTPPETCVLGRRRLQMVFDFGKSGDILGMFATNMADIDATLAWYKNEAYKFNFDKMDEKRYIYQLNEKKQHFQSIVDVLSKLK